MNTYRSELIFENGGTCMAGRIRFPEAEEKTICGFPVMHAKSEEAEYHTILSGSLWLSTPNEKFKIKGLISSLIIHYMKKYGIQKNANILFVGLGNPSVTTDSLGPEIGSRIVVTAGLPESLPQIYSISAGIPARTGFNTAELICSLTKLSSAEIIVCADSLTAVSRERLQTAIQITDVGISPGSAFTHTSEIISRETVGQPVISIGVPMAIREDSLLGIPTENPLLVTRAESDVICSCYASVIAAGLNNAFLGNNG